MDQTSSKGALGLRIIGGFKLLTGLLIFGLGIGLYRQVGGDPGQEVAHLVSTLKLDPGNHYIHAAIERVSGVSPKQLQAISLGTFLYSLLYLVEGVGLLLRKHWAEYFTVFATGVGIPFEIYEVWKRVTPLRVVVLVINVAIVGYLIYQLARGHREKAGAKVAPASSIT